MMGMCGTWLQGMMQAMRGQNVQGQNEVAKPI